MVINWIWPAAILVLCSSFISIFIFSHRKLKSQIKERENSEQALRESEERFRALSSASFGGVIIHEKGLILDCNQGLSEITGFTHEELIGMDGLKLISPATLDTVLKNISSGYDKGYDVEGVRKDGSIYPLAIRGKNTSYQGKEVRVIEFRDITAIKQSEKKRNELLIQLQQAHKMEAIGTLAGGIAHDFNNILTAILGYAEIAIEKITDDFPAHSSIKKDIAEINRAGLRARDLVKHIVDFSRKSNQQQVPVEIHSITKEAMKLIRASIPTTIEIEERINIDPINSKLLADPTQIHQIIMNLCTNAAQAMETGGGKLSIGLTSVDLSTEDLKKEPTLKPGPYIKLEVSDTGHGIDKDVRDRIFYPYFTTKAFGKGSGMGLAVVHGIIIAHGGFITVKSKSGYGTTFTVFFPKVDHEQIQEKKKQDSIPQGDEQILIIDDEPMIIDVTQQRLKQLGYHITTSNCSLDALELFSSNPSKFDLILTDQTMPNMTGEQLAKKIKKINPSIPIILYTGYSSKVDENQENSAIDYVLAKPTDLEILARTVRRFLSNSA